MARTVILGFCIANKVGTRLVKLQSGNKATKSPVLSAHEMVTGQRQRAQHEGRLEFTDLVMNLARKRMVRSQEDSSNQPSQFKGIVASCSSTYPILHFAGFLWLGE